LVVEKPSGRTWRPPRNQPGAAQVFPEQAILPHDHYPGLSRSPSRTAGVPVANSLFEAGVRTAATVASVQVRWRSPCGVEAVARSYDKVGRPRRRQNHLLNVVALLAMTPRPARGRGAGDEKGEGAGGNATRHTRSLVRGSTSATSTSPGSPGSTTETSPPSGSTSRAGAGRGPVLRRAGKALRPSGARGVVAIPGPAPPAVQLDRSPPHPTCWSSASAPTTA